MSTGGTIFTAEIDKKMAEVCPFIFGNDLHEVLFYFYGVFGICES